MFTKEDFTAENAQRLSCIIMPQMSLKPLSSFRELQPTQQKRFNRLMNEYIKELGEDWQTKLMDDFNLIVEEQILNESFNPAIFALQGSKDLLLSEEQKELVADGTIYLG